jgi:hypothetical protein
VVEVSPQRYKKSEKVPENDSTSSQKDAYNGNLNPL